MHLQLKFVFLCILLFPSVLAMRKFLRYASTKKFKGILHRGSSVKQFQNGAAGGAPVRPLVDLVALVNSEGPQAEVPRAIMDCVNKLEDPDTAFLQQAADGKESVEKFIDAEGLYRISAVLHEVNAFRRHYNLHGRAGMAESNNPHILASYIKEFFKDMTEPILTPGDIFDSLLSSTAKSGEEALAETKAILKRLAEQKPIYESTLQFMLRHFYNVSLKAGKNKMHAFNLGMTLAPSMAYRQGANVNVMAMNARGEQILGYLIQNFPNLYPELPFANLVIEDLPQ